MLLLLLLLRPAQREEVSPPPADIAMVFQSGSPKTATAPEPTHTAPPQSTGAVRPATRPAQTPPTPTRPPQPQPAPAPPPPAPAQPQKAPPAASTLPPKPAPAAPHPAAEASTQPSPARVQAAKPQPPEAKAPVAAPPKQAQQRFTAPPIQPRAPGAQPAIPPLRAPSRDSRTAAAKFPTPIMRNFYIPPARQAAVRPFPQGMESGQPAVQRGRRNDNPYDMRGAEELGSDWGRAFMAWVEQHKHYPEQAIANDEDGNSTVEFTVDRFGRVREVSLVQRSGSVWLDMGLTGLFRDAHLPPFPPGAPEHDETITFTMHYILTR